MQTNKTIWTWYIVGAAATLAYKLGQYIYEGKKKGRPAKECAIEWFFEASVANGVSWATTIFLVWAVGVSYIDRLGWLFDGQLSKIPIHPAFAGLIGSVAEVAMPASVKWLFKFLHIGE